MKLDDLMPVGGNCIMYLLSVVQENEILQWIEFGISILTSFVIIGFKVWQWFRAASKDGKITKEEIDELADIVDDAAKELDQKKGKRK